MDHVFQLSRRLARFRAPALSTLFLLAIACSENSPNEPSAPPSLNDPSNLTISPSSTTVGIDQSVQFVAATDSSGVVGSSLKRWGSGRGHGHQTPGTIVRLAMTPEAATVVQGGTSSFRATATLSDGSTVQTSVRWAATGGTVDTSGMYTAGRTAGAYRVIAAAANGVADTAAVTVTATPPVVARVELTPATVVVPPGGSERFTAVGRTSDGTTVAVTPVYVATGGTVSSNGTYSAGQTPGTHRVVATDTVSGKADTSVVTIAASAPSLQAVVLTPANVSLNPGATQQFAAVGTMSDGSTGPIAVTWTPTGGSISQSGYYTAGQVSGSYRVIASASGKADTAVVTVTATPPSPSGGIAVRPGESIQAAVNANPVGTVFILKPGTHVRQSVVPKPGNQFIGEAGVVMDGQDVAVYAFDRGARPYPANVVIKNLKITRYRPPYQMGMIRAGDAPNDGAANWLVEGNEISYSVTGGIRLADGMRVVRNNIHHNRAIGIVGIGTNVVVESNEIAWNNYLKEWNWGGEAGGTKFVLCDNLLLRDNYVHDNWGPGLWADISNIRTTYELNRIEDNNGPGIYHEISYSAIIRNNTIKRNGFGFDGWIWGGGIQISTSKDVEVYGNTLEDNKVGISVVAQVRGGDYATTNISVHDNTVTQRSGTPAGAAADIPSSRAVYYAGIKFLRNTYSVRSGNQNNFEWADGGGRSWTQWKGYGLDTSGTLNIIP